MKIRFTSVYAVIAALLSLFLTLSASADEVQVAVAANFSAPMQELATDFQRRTGHTAKLAFGATGTFYAQIHAGAPFAVFLSADAKTPRLLEQEQLAVSDTRFVYAIGKLALWSANPTLVDPAGAVLKGAHFAHIAVANPTTAPYGVAAVQVLKGMGLYDVLQPKVVQGENISQTFQFVTTGNAELGFVALSQIYKNGKVTSGSAWIVPAPLYTPLQQEAILLNPGKDSPAAKAMLEFLKSDEAKAVIRSYGYDL